MQQRAVGVVAQGADVRHAGALPGGGDREVGGVTPESLAVPGAALLAGLVELDHGLAERDDVRDRRGGRRCEVLVHDV